MMRKRYLLFILCCYSGVSLAFGWNDLWFNKFHQGVQRYREKNYNEAMDLFSQSNTAHSNYNRGNALAFSKKYQEAIQAYDKALKLNSKMADAKYNREIIKKLLAQQKKQQKDEKKDEQKQKQKQSKNEQKNPQKDDENKKDQKNDQNKPGEKQQEKDKTQKDQQKQETQEPRKQDDPKSQKGQDNQQAKAEMKNQEQGVQHNKVPQTAEQKEEARNNREKSQAEKQLLNTIPDDPGGLLRRKFQRDFERRQMEAKGW